MGLVELASIKSVWRGMDYYQKRKSAHGLRQETGLMMESYQEVRGIDILYILIKYIHESRLATVHSQMAGG